MHKKCRRHISQQLIEDSFNTIKHAVDQRSNSTATPTFAMAKLLDNRVLETKYSFKEVKRADVLDERNVSFPAETWTPVLQRNKLDPDVRALEFNKVAGYQDPDWFSPGASGYLGPLADLEVARQADARNQLPLVGHRDYCRLVHKGIMLRRAGDDGAQQWYIGVGSCDGSIAMGWPSKEIAQFQFVPDLSKQRELLAILDPEDWIAQPIQWISPLHRAVLVEMEGQGKTAQQEVELKGSHEYGMLHMTARVVGHPRPLWQLACHFGFWSLPLTFLRALCARRGIELSDTTLLTTLESMYIDAFPECSRDAIIAMLDRRGVAFEHTMSNVDDLLAMEDLCDQFDKGFSEALLAECKEARGIRANYNDYSEELVKYKAFPFIRLCFGQVSAWVCCQRCGRSFWCPWMRFFFTGFFPQR